MEKIKLAVLDAYASNPGDMSWDEVTALCEATINDRTPRELTVSRLKGVEAALTNKTVLDRKVLSECPQLKYIGVLATGYNIIDTEYAAERGIVVCNAPAYSTESVVQHTLALILECCSHVGEYAASVAAGDWCKSPDFTYMLSPITELSGKTLGIIGYGSIGRRVGEVAAALGMKIMAYSRSLTQQNAAAGVVAADIPAILSQCDVITLHCPATAQTTGMINAQSLAGVKRGAILVNTARGALVDEAAVAAALENGTLGCYAADVAGHEPPAADCPLLTAKNCVLTPHIAWATNEARRRLMRITVDNLKSYLNGAPVNRVN